MVRPPVLGDWTAEFGYLAGRELLNRADFTAVFCSNDLTALGLLHAFREAGIRVPADVSVVGFDDVPEAAHFWPPLTTIRQDFAEVGRRALALLLSELGSGDDRDHRSDPSAAWSCGRRLALPAPAFDMVAAEGILYAAACERSHCPMAAANAGRRRCRAWRRNGDERSRHAVRSSDGSRRWLLTRTFSRCARSAKSSPASRRSTKYRSRSRPARSTRSSARTARASRR